MTVNANAIQGIQPGPARNQLARSPEVVNREKKGTAHWQVSLQMQPREAELLV